MSKTCKENLKLDCNKGCFRETGKMIIRIYAITSVIYGFKIYALGCYSSGVLINGCGRGDKGRIR